MISTTTEVKHNNSETILLKAPQLIPQNLVRVVKKSQAYRKGGLRIQHEEINGKHIFHNYGHGSSGIGLAYGSIFNSVKTLDTHVSIDNPRICAVIGSGLFAMWTAVQLARVGCFVTVYAQKFGRYGDKKKQTDFDIEQGLWLPYGYDIADNLLHEVFTKTSYDYYRDCMKTKRYQGIKMTTIYEKDQTIQELKKVIPSFVYNGYRPVNIDFGNGNTQKYTRLRLMRIDSQLFMQQLRTQASLRGVKFVQRTFNTLDQVLSIPQQSIYNCLDHASGKLFNDQNVITTVDNLVIFKNTTGLDYALSVKLKDNLHMRISTVGDKIILRSQSTVDDSNGSFVAKLIQQANNYFANRSIKANL